MRHPLLALAAPVALAMFASWAIPAAAQTGATSVTATPTPARELLNSERIEAQFGSYGIEVLASDANLRVSNLFSEADGQRTTRTFAVVFYPGRIDRRFAAEHRRILDGGSIGAVFAQNGWTVIKEHRYFGEIMASASVAGLMRIAPMQSLALHVYVLHVAKAGALLEYAAIAEVHHPDYFQARDLAEIYGEANAAQPTDDALVERIISATRAAMD